MRLIVGAALGILLTVFYFRGLPAGLVGVSSSQLPAAAVEQPVSSIKSAVKTGFWAAAALIVLFAIVSGDGLLGELPVVVVSFLLFWPLFSIAAWLVF